MPIWISVPFTLVVSIFGWTYFSAFVHELFHLITSFAVGFKISEYRLWSAPWGVRGYVDVIIPRGIRYYYLKRGLMHISGIGSHLILIITISLCLVLYHGAVIMTFLITGLAVNIYLVGMNIFPVNSDGRQFWVLFRNFFNNVGADYEKER